MIKMQAVGTLAGGIAHEFNNIFAIIMGRADMAIEELPQGSFAKKQLDSIMKTSYRARELVRSILTFSRQQTRQKRISSDLCTLIRDSLKFINFSIPSSVCIKENID